MATVRKIFSILVIVLFAFVINNIFEVIGQTNSDTPIKYNATNSTDHREVTCNGIAILLFVNKIICGKYYQLYGNTFTLTGQKAIDYGERNNATCDNYKHDVNSQVDAQPDTSPDQLKPRQINNCLFLTILADFNKEPCKGFYTFTSDNVKDKGQEAIDWVCDPDKNCDPDQPVNDPSNE